MYDRSVPDREDTITEFHLVVPPQKSLETHTNILIRELRHSKYTLRTESNSGRHFDMINANHPGLRSALGPSSTVDPGTERHSIQGIDLIDASVELYVGLNSFGPFVVHSGVPLLYVQHNFLI